ncbi:MAG: hypothetical protein R3B81_19310 [bacterium]
MKKLLTVAALALLVPTMASAGANTYGWSVSGSSSTPDNNIGAPSGTPGLVTLYCWMECTSNGGWSAAEFDVAATGALSVVGFTPMNGVLNAGTATALLIAVGGCPEGQFLAGSWSIFDTGTGGTICTVDSAQNGWHVSVDCDPVNPTTHTNSRVGFTSDGSALCENQASPCIVPVEETSWSTVKALYR